MHIASSKRESAPRRAAARLCAWLAVMAILWALACTSDNETPVGSDLANDILGSHQGTTRYDTLPAIDDTVHTYYTLIDKDVTLQVGQDSGYVRAMILRPNFSSAPAFGDTGRTVKTAELRVVRSSGSTVEIPARFYRMGKIAQVDLEGNPTGDSLVWAEGGSIKTIDTLGVLIDPTTGNAQRAMTAASALFPVDSALTQAWIRGEEPNDGILVLYDDPVNDKLATFASRENTSDPATFKVTFTDNVQRFYKIAADGTLMRPQQTTTNLIVSDGYVRRINLDAELSVLSDSAAVHNALLRLFIVPGTDLGLNLNVTLYIPNSDDPLSSSFLTGTQVTTKFVDVGLGVVDFTGINMTIALQNVLEGQAPENGFALKMLSENTELRQVEFYGSNAPDSLRPRFFLTTSSPAEFDR